MVGGIEIDGDHGRSGTVVWGSYVRDVLVDGGAKKEDLAKELGFNIEVLGLRPYVQGIFLISIKHMPLDIIYFFTYLNSMQKQRMQ